MQKFKDYNEVDILYSLISYVNVSSNQDMYYTIASTILSDLEKIPSICINDLADLCYTSPATISRFCKDLGCKNFASFKHELEVSLKQTSHEIHLSKKDSEKIEKDPQYLVNKVYLESINSLQRGMQSINIHSVDKICQMIHNANKVHMLGLQFNKIIANDFQLKLLKLKKFIYAFVERGDEIQRLDMIDKDTLTIILSVSAKEEFMHPLIKKLKEKHPQILLITLNKDYVNEEIDYIYCLDGTESDYTESSMQGTTSILTLLDLIYLRYGVLYKK